MEEAKNDAIQENLLDNNINNENNIENNIQINQNLPQINELINPDEEIKLKTIDDQLNEDYYPPNENIKILEEDDDDKETSTPRIIYNIKNYVFIFCLLFSSFLNYNFLYFPYIILGFILSFFLFRNKIIKIYNFRKISELIIMIYSILLLAFKIVFIILMKKDYARVNENENLFINFGVKTFKDRDSSLYLVSSFLSESIIILISLASFIISLTFVDYKLEVEEDFKKKSINEMHNLLIKHLIINYFIFLCFAILNTSILTLVYLSLIGIILFFTGKKDNLNRMLFLYKAVVILNYIFLIIQIFFINLLNCYTFEGILADKMVDTGSREKYYSIYTIAGIRGMLKNETLTKRLVHCFCYFFNIVAYFQLQQVIIYFLLT